MTAEATVTTLPAGRHHGGVPWPQARATAAAAGVPLVPRRVPLAGAIGRRLVSDLVALAGLPAGDLSAMDGWAVSGPPPWRVVADLSAGSVPRHALDTGQCARIATGASVPDGTDAVLPVERSSVGSDGVRPAGAWPSGKRHIRRAGEEAQPGDLLLPPGVLVTPPVAGLAASVGHDELLVAPAACVDVLVLGDELATRGLPGPGRTRDALGPQLPAWLAALGAEVRDPRRLPDDCAALTAALRDSAADVVVSTGGTSVGEHDHVHAAIERAGGRLLVDGVDVKPGHPMLLARLPRGRWLVGLPGNPLAACVSLVTLLEPLLRTLHAEPEQPVGRVVLSSDQPGRPGDGHRLLPVRADGAGRADVLPSCGSAMLRGLAQATGLAVLRPSGARTGEEVGYLALPWS